MTVTPFFHSVHPWSLPEDRQEAPQPTLLDRLVRLGQPLLSADEANEKIIELTVENLRLQAQIDARAMVKELTHG